MKAFKHTLNDQIAFSPKFTICDDCNQTFLGLADVCPHFQSENVDYITKVSRYFVRGTKRTKMRFGEMKDRYKSDEYFRVPNRAVDKAA